MKYAKIILKLSRRLL